MFANLQAPRKVHFCPSPANKCARPDLKQAWKGVSAGLRPSVQGNATKPRIDPILPADEQRLLTIRKTGSKVTHFLDFPTVYLLNQPFRPVPGDLKILREFDLASVYGSAFRSPRNEMAQFWSFNLFSRSKSIQ